MENNSVREETEDRNAAQQQESLPPQEKKRRKWELLTIKYFQILLDYNLFQYGGRGEVLK